MEVTIKPASSVFTLAIITCTPWPSAPHSTVARMELINIGAMV